MFTGLVETVGNIESVESDGGDGRRICISALELFSENPPELGASIAVEGVCLTVVDLTSEGFHTELSGETLACTTLDQFEPGDRVNLETSLCVGDELGGHFVFGHVDDVVTIRSFESVGEGHDLSVELPGSYAPFLARKGSVALDGISLTVNQVTEQSFKVRIIPHTYQQTSLRYKSKGDRMNLEVDMMARYVRRQLSETH